MSNTHFRHLVLAGAALVLSACSQPQAEQAGQQALPQVDVAQVIQERITEWDEFTGRLQAPETVTLVPRVSGYIQEVHFKEGAMVEAGELLFQIDPNAFIAEVQRLSAELTSAQTAQQLAANDFERANKLFGHNAVSAELLDSRLAHKRQTAAAVASVQAALDKAKLDLSYTKVTAPIAGRVSYALVTAGNYVSAGQSQLTRLVSTANMHAYFDVDEQTYLKYARLTAQGKLADKRDGGNPVYMALANDSDFNYVGKVDFVDNAVDQRTGTIRVRASFDNRDNLLLPGLFARIRVAGSASYDAVLIDDKAIGTDLNNKFVLLVNEQNQLEYRGVTLGEKVRGLRIISQGLSANDRIVVKGLQRVRPKMQVEPKPVAMAAPEQLESLRSQQVLLDKSQDDEVAEVSTAAAHGVQASGNARASRG
ncbi:efflux RND transporter periplasmic adaptor subunit [Shewanella sp. AS16]|uniref:efflux RND transporter periplasmic adaptor subunit n=1 Tax=Shewanella sp. AS16 TaxID=2907625 RepID=UPI001F2E5398|nr:efflux RND transporter periplasmic adaptor subunit [Shewanella sp. AS16]MCE9686421.1 efflux RND transporter periplasmic adaptor subunit [Shewanella sp. AS16]